MLKPLRSVAIALLLAVPAAAQAPAKPGVPAVQRPVAELPVAARFPIAKNADWVAITPDAVWVAGFEPHGVHRIDPRTNRDTLTVLLPGEPCAGLAAGFGRLWVPLCAKAPAMAVIDLKSGRLLAVRPFGPAAEGGVAAGRDSVWLAGEADGTLLRINPRTLEVRQRIRVAPGSQNPIVSRGVVWITSGPAGVVTAVDEASGRVLERVVSGLKPRFLAAGAGSVWVLNQGDGSVTRIDERTRHVLGHLQVGIPGGGGDIAAGEGRIWATSIGVPLTVIEPLRNTVARQWVGPGGDSLRIGHGAVWLTDYRGGALVRIPAAAALAR